MRIPKDLIIKNREFIGIVLPDLDPKNQGRYKVHIPELMPHIDVTDGIWVRNNVHKYRITDSNNGTYGQYLPLQPGTIVVVKFYANDFNSGYIERIISDNKPSCLKKPPLFDVDQDLQNRDERYILIKTHRYNTYIVINENTTDDPNTLWIVYNRDNTGRRTVIRVNQEGIHIYTRDNYRKRVKKDNDAEVDGNYSLVIHGDCNIAVDGNCNITTSSNCNVKASGNVNIDGATVNINCGLAQEATTNPVQDLE